MRLKRITLRGVTTFSAAAPASIDLDALGGGLVALVGANGAGKTTLLEAPVAALYRAFPSRPGWYENLHGRDAFIEATFDDGGHVVTVRTQVDVERRTTEQFVFLDGAAVTSGKKDAAASFIADRFGSFELLLASVFASQGRQGNFLLLPKAERKALFAELLGLWRLEFLHERAKERQAAADKALAVARAALEAAELEISILPVAEGEVADARAVADKAAHDVEAARTEEASAVALLERAKGVQERLRLLVAALTSAEREETDARAAVGAAERLERQAEEAARTRSAALARLNPDEDERRAQERRARALEGIVRRRQDLERTLAQRPDLEAARDQVVELRAEQERLEAGERTLAQARAEKRLAEEQLTAAQRRLEDARRTWEREKAQLERQAGLLGEVPCTAQEMWSQAGKGLPALVNLAKSCSLLADARDAAQRAQALVLDPEMEAPVTAARARLEATDQALEQATVACDPLRLAEVKTAIAPLQEKAARLPLLVVAAGSILALEDETAQADKQLSEDLHAVKESRAHIEGETKGIERDLRKALTEAADQQKAAAARLQGAAGRLSTAREELKAAREETGGLDVSVADASLTTARETRYAAERRLREADQALAGHVAKVDQLQAKAATIDGLKDAARAAEQDLGDWNLLEKAFGRDGIQALEIDAAGPEVARIANELLEACYGARFRISFETLREKKSARGEYAEAFDVKVYDGGHERAVEALSGGERVVVGEAIGLALSIFNARKSGVRHETLYRDETAGALDPQNAQAYVDMLRRALALGGFEQVLFVSHSPEVWQRADVRLVVAGGRVAVEGSGKTPAEPGAHNPSGRGPDEPVGAAIPGRGTG